MQAMQEFKSPSVHLLLMMQEERLSAVSIQDAYRCLYPPELYSLVFLHHTLLVFPPLKSTWINHNPTQTSVPASPCAHLLSISSSVFPLWCVVPSWLNIWVPTLIIVTTWVPTSHPVDIRTSCLTYPPHRHESTRLISETFRLRSTS